MDYITDFRKSYESVEMFAARKEVFKANYLKVDLHNKDIEKTYTMALTQFSDWTQEEFEEILTFKVPAKRSINLDDSQYKNLKKQDKDWKKEGKVNKVKDQKSCGSCWAFSATGALESAWAVKTGKINDFSEQQLVDCSRDQGNGGCNGGWMNQAFNYYQLHGPCFEKDYEYTARDETCKSDKCE